MEMHSWRDRLGLCDAVAWRIGCWERRMHADALTVTGSRSHSKASND
jgi:hypothetical protein